MKTSAMNFRASAAGFTLIELLVVIAILAILAALLLPTLAKGKAAAQSAACKSNLRQLGMALNLYVNDYDKYPGNGAKYSGGQFQGIWATGLNWLNPYLGRRFDPEIGSDWFYWFPNSPTVFNCPAVKPRYIAGFLGWSGQVQYDLGYGYNELGTGWKNQRPQLGLGFQVEFTGYGPTGLPLGQRTYVNLADVKSPSAMIAIGDGATWLGPNILGGVLEFTNGTVTAPHTGGANIVYSDGHVGYGKRDQWVGNPRLEWKQWNNDDKPHQETW